MYVFIIYHDPIETLMSLHREKESLVLDSVGLVSEIGNVSISSHSQMQIWTRLYFLYHDASVLWGVCFL